MTPLPLILDTDIGTDVDDALALAFALRHPGLDLRAVTTVSGDVTRRARLAAGLLRLAGRRDVEVAAGVGGFTGPGVARPAEMGHEDEFVVPAGGSAGDSGPAVSDRDAVTLLLEETAAVPGTAVATVGMQTNVAVALERDPGLVDRVAIYAVMGGVFAPLRFLGRELPVAADHNLDVDPDGAVLALNAGLPTLYVPCDVTFGAFLERRHLDSLRGGDELCRVLADHVDVWAKVVARGRGAMPEQYVALLHDPLTVACLVDRRFVTSERRPVTVGRVGPLARTFVDPVAGREAEVVTSVDAPAFADFWLETVLG